MSLILLQHSIYLSGDGVSEIVSDMEEINGLIEEQEDEVEENGWLYNIYLYIYGS